jgi:uncharacterized protein (UPF0548 family)
MNDGWHVLRGWPEERLRRELAHLARVPLAHGVDPACMTRDRGWNQVQSHSLVACERPGPPAEVFERLRRAVERFEHSDPRIVLAHFDPGTPLLGRNLLLELQALGLHFLAPVRVGAVREEPHVAGYCLDTLPGHIEIGREWFLLHKDPQTGEIRFRIDAAWARGQFPGWWARAGFTLVGRRYQRAWHRLAHARLRRLAGSPVRLGPVQVYAVRALQPASAHLERELERRPTHHRHR